MIVTGTVHRLPQWLWIERAALLQLMSVPGTQDCLTFLAVVESSRVSKCLGRVGKQNKGERTITAAEEEVWELFEKILHYITGRFYTTWGDKSTRPESKNRVGDSASAFFLE